MAIAVPVTVIAAIGSASRFGVIIRSGEAFEQLGAVRTVAFDKTGTLTRNAPRVVEVRTAAPGSVPETRERARAWALMVAAGLERTSTHPLAAAVVAAADEAVATAGIDRDLLVSDVTEEPGHGLTGVIDGRHVRVGGPRWIAPGPLQAEADAMAAAGMSLVVGEEGDQVTAVIGIRDERRLDAAPAVRELRDAGVGTVMLTGDNPQTAHALAKQVGITDVRAALLPADKAEAVTSLGADQPTAMVGDGVNDAPALAAATVGIAMGATGSAAAVEAADVAFTGHDLRLLTRALRHARRGRAIMTQNIGLALAIIVALLPLALFGVLGLAEVVLVHELAEVVVIANGLRAARVRTDPLPPLQGDPAADSGPRVQGTGTPVVTAG
jgi:cation-transporting ATPase G